MHFQAAFLSSCANNCLENGVKCQCTNQNISCGSSSNIQPQLVQGFLHLLATHTATAVAVETVPITQHTSTLPIEPTPLGHWLLPCNFGFHSPLANLVLFCDCTHIFSTLTVDHSIQVCELRRRKRNIATLPFLM